MADDKKPIQRVQRMVEAGCPVADAIRIVLGGSVPKWAAAKGLHRVPVTMTISGTRVPPDRRVLAALVKELQASELEIRQLLSKATEEAVAQRLAAAQ